MGRAGTRELDTTRPCVSGPEFLTQKQLSATAAARTGDLWVFWHPCWKEKWSPDIKVLDDLKQQKSSAYDQNAFPGKETEGTLGALAPVQGHTKWMHGVEDGQDDPVSSPPWCF